MFKLYFKYLKYYKKEVILGPLFKLLEAIFELFVPLVIASLINEGINKNNTNYVIYMFLLLIFLAIIGLLSTLVCQYFASKASMGVGTKLREDLYKHILNYDKFTFDNYSSSYLLQVLNNDIKQFEYSVAMLIRLVIRAPFIVIGAIIMSFILNINYGFIILITSIILLIFILYIMIKTIPLNKKVAKNLDEVTLDIKEVIEGNRLVRAFNAYDLENNNFINNTNSLYMKNKKVSLINSLLSPISIFIINAGIIISLIISHNLINKNLILDGDILALINYFNQVLVASLVVCNLIIVFAKTIVSSKRINDCFNTISIEKNINNEKIKTDTTYDYLLSINNLNYKFYENSQNVLTNINVNIKEHELIGIIGPTGSGKTTLLNIIANLYDNYTGNIYYKGLNIKDINKYNYYNLISYIKQEHNLLNKTIKENILFGHENNINDKLLNDSLTNNIILKKEQGLDELICDNGANLSGGEKRRIEIARTLNKNTDLILLDQALAGLDNNSLKIVLNNLINLNKTIILVTDNIYALKKCNNIIFIDNGSILGYDNFNNLYENNESFRTIIGDNNE